MAEVNNAGSVVPPELRTVAKAEEEEVVADTQMTGETATSTVGAPMSEVSSAVAPTPGMPAPEGFTPGDLAMNMNPATTAQAPSVDHNPINSEPSSFVAASQAAPQYTATPEDDPRPAPLPATSATGWLVPSAATPASRITFDGMSLISTQITLLFLVLAISYKTHFYLSREHLSPSDAVGSQITFPYQRSPSNGEIAMMIRTGGDYKRYWLLH